MELVKLKDELSFNAELTDLIEIMRDIAISQYHSLEREEETFGRFLEELDIFFRMVQIGGSNHPLVKAPDNVPTGIIMVTSDAGFMGGLNMRVIEAGLDKYNSEWNQSRELQPKLVIVGERGAAYLKDLGYPFTFFRGVSGEKKESLERAGEIKDYLVQEITGGRLGRVVLFYPRPISFVIQKIEKVDLLPFTKADQKAPPLEKRGIVFESSFDDIVRYLVSVWAGYRLYEVFEESKLSEFAARAVHLEERRQNLISLSNNLRFRYLRAKHEVVDKSMRESFASSLLKGE